MTDSRDRTKHFRRALVVVPLALLLGGCTAGGETANPPGVPSSSATPEAAVSPSPSPTALEFPDQAEGEVARAEYRDVGAEGVPESRSVAIDAVTDGSYTVEGACIGTRASYKVETAEAEPDRRELTSATMSCDSPSGNTFAVSGYEGPVQLSFTDTDRIDTGWVRIVSAAP